MTNKTLRPYGLWESPVTPALTGGRQTAGRRGMGLRWPDGGLARRAVGQRGAGGPAADGGRADGADRRSERPRGGGLRRRRFRRPRRLCLLRGPQAGADLSPAVGWRRGTAGHTAVRPGGRADGLARRPLAGLCTPRRRRHRPAGRDRHRREALAPGVGRRRRFLHAAPLQPRRLAAGLDRLEPSQYALGRLAAPPCPGRRCRKADCRSWTSRR